MHAILRGNDRAPLFAERRDFEGFRHCAVVAACRFGVRVHAYVLMTNHVHLLVTPQSPSSLPRTMHWLGSVFVQQINTQYARTGSRLEGRYKARHIQTDDHFLACMRYIEDNPVRASMVAAPADYPWSSHHANAYGVRDDLVSSHPLFAALGNSREERATSYRALFDAPVSASDLESIRMPVRPRGRPKKGSGLVMGSDPIS